MEKDNKENKISKLKTTFRVLNILFCIVFVLIVLLYVHLGRVVSVFLNPETLKDSVNKTTGLVLDLKKPEITTTYDLCLNIRSDLIKLSAPDDSLELFSLQNADVKIKIVPLMFKKIEFKRFQSFDAKVNIKRDKTGKFNFEKYFKGDKEFPFEFVAKSATVLVSMILI